MRTPAAVAAFLVLASFVALPALPVPATVYPATPWMSLAANTSFPLAGERVSVDVWTYAGADPVNASSGPSVSASWDGTALPTAPPVQLGTGHYRTSLTVPTNGPPGQPGPLGISLSAGAQVGGTNLTVSHSLNWYTPGPFLRFYANLTTVALVQRLHLTAEVYNDTALVDADPDSVWFAPGGSAAYAVPGNRTTVGVYEADLTWNSGPLGTPYLLANASYHGAVLTRRLTVTRGPIAFPMFDLVHPAYQAWFHLVASNATAAQGDVWVADADGHPAAGVPVNLTTYVIPTSPTAQINGLTDASGRLPVILPLVYGTTRVTGTVGGSSPLALQVGGSVPAYPCLSAAGPAASTPLTELNPPVLPDRSLRDFLQPGASVVRSFHAAPFLPGANPYAGAPLTYRLVGSSGAVYGTGHAVADAAGNFSLSFTAPPEDVQLQIDFGPSLLPASLGYVVASPEMGLQVSPLALGGPTWVRASFAGREATFADAGVMFGVGSVRLLTDAGGEWDDWGRFAACSWDRLVAASGGLNITFHLPSFLPPAGTYLVDAFDYADGGPDRFVLLSPGQAADLPIGGPGNGGLAGDLLWVLVLAALVAAVAVLGVAIYLRRKPRAPPQAPPKPPAR